MILIAATIAGLLRGRAVVAQPIGLDDQPQVGPEEVDAETIEVLASERNRQSRLGRERQEEPLELRIGESKRAPVEQLAQPSNASAPSVSLKPDAQSLRINQVKPIRLVHRPLDLSVAEPYSVTPTTESRYVNESKNRLGHRDPLASGEVPVPKPVRR
jgi:hypothetical protein